MQNEQCYDSYFILQQTNWNDDITVDNRRRKILHAHRFWIYAWRTFPNVYFTVKHNSCIWRITLYTVWRKKKICESVEASIIISSVPIVKPALSPVTAMAVVEDAIKVYYNSTAHIVSIRRNFHGRFYVCTCVKIYGKSNLIKCIYVLISTYKTFKTQLYCNMNHKELKIFIKVFQ